MKSGLEREAVWFEVYTLEQVGSSEIREALTVEEGGSPPCWEAGGSRQDSSPHLQKQDNNPCLRHYVAPVSWRRENLDRHTGWRWLLLCERSASKNQMSWLITGRAYVIKLFHDIPSRSGVRAKNDSSALVKC